MKKFLTAGLIALALSASVSFTASAQETKSAQDSGFWFDVAASAGGMIMRNPEISKASFGMNRTSYGLEAVFGYRFNNYVALGAGAQFVGEINRNDVALPIIVRVRYDILDRMVSPFVAADLGYTVYPYKERPRPQFAREGLIGSGTVGVAIKSDGNHRAYLGLVASAVQVTNKEINSWIRKFRPEFRIKLGYEF